MKMFIATHWLVRHSETLAHEVHSHQSTTMCYSVLQPVPFIYLKKGSSGCHQLCRTHFGQYQASSAMLEWLGDGEHMHEQSMNHISLSLHVMQSYPLYRTCFYQYQVSSAVLRWPRDWGLLSHGQNTISALSQFRDRADCTCSSVYFKYEAAFCT